MQTRTPSHAVRMILAALMLPAMTGHAQTVTSTRPDFAASATMRIDSDAFAAQAAIPQRFSGYGESTSPSLHWNAVPGAKSYMIIVEDPDARPATVVHWLLWNIPATATGLREGLPSDARLSDPQGAVQGSNSHESVGYAGPHPPGGDPSHHYHFQIFALDQLLDVAPGASRDAVVAAAAGHVLAKGDLVGLYAKDADVHTVI